jgi:hypothetical protein
MIFNYFWHMARQAEGEEPKTTISLTIDKAILKAAKDLQLDLRVKSFSVYIQELLKKDLEKHGKKLS